MSTYLFTQQFLHAVHALDEGVDGFVRTHSVWVGQCGAARGRAGTSFHLAQAVQTKEMGTLAVCHRIGCNILNKADETSYKGDLPTWCKGCGSNYKHFSSISYIICSFHKIQIHPANNTNFCSFVHTLQREQRNTFFISASTALVCLKLILPCIPPCIFTLKILWLYIFEDCIKEVANTRKCDSLLGKQERNFII